jgi:RimJ/RimL family protein N-acetyltransferase
MAAADWIEHEWRGGLPVLSCSRVVLRDLRASDAAPLFEALAPPEVSRFMLPPPGSVEGFHAFIEWAWRERSSGRMVCYAVTEAGGDKPIGLCQVRCMEGGFATAEWGAVLGASYWGTGIFREAATLVIDFAFDTLGVHRLEARASMENGRGLRALERLGAVQEGVLRQALWRDGRYQDQTLFAILDADWRTARRSERLGGHGPRGVAAPFAPGAGVKLPPAHPRVLEREQVVARGHTRPAITHHAI